MGGASSALCASSTTNDKTVVNNHPEDVDKAGLLYPGKESFVADEFTRWSVNMTMEIVFEKFEELLDSKPSERVILAVVHKPPDGEKKLDKWNDVEVGPNTRYVKTFIIDFDPTKSSGPENLTIYSFLVQEQYEDKIDQWLSEEIAKIS